MNGLPVSVGCISLGTLSREQDAAYELCEETVVDADLVSLGAVRRGETDLSAYDALWWHDESPLADEQSVEECAPEIRDFLADGGGLFLSLHAMSAVTPLGIEEIPPDETGFEELTREDGLLWTAAHDDHPAVADGRLRVTTLPAGPVHPYARYEEVIPQRGELLASMVRGPDDSPYEMSAFAWRHGDGTVVGVGSGLVFADAEAYAAERRRVVRGVLSSVADSGTEPESGLGTEPESGVGAEPESSVETDSETTTEWSPTGRPKSADELAARRASLDAADRHRPRYHLSPPGNWLNDPNGLVQYDGRYHVFYQYNPAGPFHHAIHWGHAVSDDLVHWEDEPVALTPSPDGPDRDGCWSGCTVVDEEGTPTLLYTGGRGKWQLPCLATTDDPDLRTWTKSEGNPIIEEPPTGIDLRSTDHWHAEFRDHCVWREGGEWYQLVGSGIEGVGGTALLYRGESLLDWEYVGPVTTAEEDDAGAVWECPELLDLGETQLLHVSNYSEVRYFLGEFADDAFHRERSGVLDHGDYYAPQSMRDDEGRILTWGWVKEARDGSAQWDAGWSGTMSLPRVLDADADGTLVQRPPAELRELREECLRTGATTISPGESESLGVEGRALEFRLTVELGDADEFELVVFESPDGKERTPIRVTHDEVLVDRSASSSDPAASPDPQSIPLEGDETERPLSVHGFVDGSVIELFVNERHCLTSRVYPERPDSDGVSVSATGGRVELPSFDLWRLGSAWSR